MTKSLSKLSRRQFLALGTFSAAYSAASGGVAAIAYSIDPEDTPEAAAPESELKNYEESEQDAILKLMEDYEVPNQELATELYNHLKTEFVSYAAGGGAMAFPVAVGLKLNTDPENDGFFSFIKRQNLIKAAGAAGFWPINEFDEALRPSKITADLLETKYGLSPENAQKLQDDHYSDRAIGMVVPSLLASLIME